MPFREPAPIGTFDKAGGTGGGGMGGWNDRYFDSLDQLYWKPSNVGMGSIKKDQWVVDDGQVSVPAHLVKEDRLYVRERKASEMRAYLNARSDILNHLFSLTFSIAGDAVTRAALLDPLGVTDPGPFEIIGRREMRHRYGWGESKNVAQPHCFFTGPDCVVGVKLTPDSKRGREDIVKYAVLVAWEELTSGPRAQLGWLFIVPATSKVGHWSRYGLEGPHIDHSFMDGELVGKMNPKIRKLIKTHPEHVASVLDRLTLAVISWNDLHDRLNAVQAALNPSSAGDQTLHRLLGGFLAQLRAHEKTGVD